MGMTIAIKDFELPPSCYNCNFCMRRRTSDYGYFGMCDLTNEEGINLYEHSRSEDCPLVEAIPKADYEARLRADMMTMLEEIQLEIADNVESIIGHYDASIPERKRPLCKSARNEGRTECIDVIQQKINSLKENERAR